MRPEKQINSAVVMSYTVMLFVAVCACQAAAETVILDFHDSSTVNDTVFTLGDVALVQCGDPALKSLFERIPAGTSAPPSYGRFLGTNEFVALRLDKKFPGVKFSAEGAARTFVRTAFTTLRISEYLHFIKDTLDASVGWGSGTWNYTVGNPDDSLHVLKSPVRVKLEGMEQPFFPRGKVSLELAVEQAGKRFHLPVRCDFTVAVPVLVAGRDIARGELFSADDCMRKTVDITHFGPAPICSDSAITGKMAARSIRQGTVLHERLIKTPPLVEKGDPVSIVQSKRGISISINGTARESGLAGEKIWVENGVTNKLIRARVIDKGTVVVASGGKRI